MPTKAVIFDVDGVLVDSYYPHFESWRRMLGEMDVELTEAEFRATFGRTSRDIIAALYDGTLSDEEIARFDDRKEAYYREIVRDDFPAMEGAAALMAALAEAGFALAVGSSGPPENVALVVEKLGCEDLLGAQVTGSDVSRGKPDPQVFLIAAERLGVAPEHSAVVEDAVAGVEAANRAGMASIGLVGTASREELAAADLVVDRLTDLSPERISELIDQAAKRHVS